MSHNVDWKYWYELAVKRDLRLRPLVIAEIGINHNGSVELACDIMSMAKAAGADAVKFQKREPEFCVPVDVRGNMRSTPWGDMTYLDYKKRIEFDVDDFRIINQHAAEIGIDWFHSSWDTHSQLAMRVFNAPVNKVASAMLTHAELLRLIAAERKLTFISTGMSDLQEIDAAISIFRAAECPFVLMHSVSTYPADESNLNLRVMHLLRERYQCPVGYSGHEVSVSPSVVAVALGAVAVERHVTLDRTMWGTDQAASLEKPGLTSLVEVVHRVPIMLGDGVKRVIDEEKLVASNLRYFQ